MKYILAVMLSLLFVSCNESPKEKSAQEILAEKQLEDRKKAEELQKKIAEEDQARRERTKKEAREALKRLEE